MSIGLGAIVRNEPGARWVETLFTPTLLTGHQPNVIMNVGANSAEEAQTTMSDSLLTYRQAIINVIQELAEEYLRSLLDYAEYLRQRQACENAEDIADSQQALQEEGTIPWEEVKREMRAGVQS